MKTYIIVKVAVLIGVSVVQSAACLIETVKDVIVVNVKIVKKNKLIYTIWLINIPIKPCLTVFKTNIAKEWRVMNNNHWNNGNFDRCNKKNLLVRACGYIVGFLCKKCYEHVHGSQ